MILIKQYFIVQYHLARTLTEHASKCRSGGKGKATRPHLTKKIISVLQPALQVRKGERLYLQWSVSGIDSVL